MLGYNSDHEAAAKARTELEDRYGVRSVCVQVCCRLCDSRHEGSAYITEYPLVMLL